MTQTKTNLVHLALEELQPFIDYPDATEVCVNRFGEVWIETAKDGFLPPIEAPKLNKDYFEFLMMVLANSQGGWFRLENPQVSAELPGGHRFEGILSQSAVKTGIAASIRIKRDTDHFGMDDFGFNGRKNKIVKEKKQQSFADIVDTITRGLYTQKYVVFVSGCMGSGKTTLFNCLLKSLPKNTRIISVEDTFELNLEKFPNSNSILVDRNDKEKLFDYNNAISSILRLRPDVICAGEVSIDNTLPILRLLNLGHGFICTLHASNATSALTKVFQQNIRLQGGNIEGVYDVLKDSVDAVIQMDRFGSERVVTEVFFPKENYLWENDKIFTIQERKINKNEKQEFEELIEEGLALCN